MSLQVLSAHFRSYIQALERLQLDIVTRNDLLGVEDAVTRGSGLFSRAKEPLKNRSAVFALGDRASVLKVSNMSSYQFSCAEAIFIKFSCSNDGRSALVNLTP